MAVAAGPGVSALPLPCAFQVCNDQALSADALMRALGTGAAGSPKMHQKYEDDACPYCRGIPLEVDVSPSKDCFWCQYTFNPADGRSTWELPMTYESPLMDFDPTLPLQDPAVPLVQKSRLAIRLGIRVSGAGKGSADDGEIEDDAAVDEASAPARELVLERASIADRRSTGDVKLVVESPPLESKLASVAITCQWKDQDWGNTRSRISAAIFRADEEVVTEDLFGECRQDGVYGWKDVARNLGPEAPVVAQSRAGDKLVFRYCVGGGGGHELYVKDFRSVLRFQA
eukprot:TRINITY_DN23189_c0_g1_i1.p1 TRINITY_DN23189_c0_g1~~TRINITY_DN23189_c0_g1_i1.p1  ORF type:complete len:320 (+),score=52.05 TRINITY_DN23189_c0_g1_i1:104-961(+)